MASTLEVERPANVWLASYPKSGNTWFRFVWKAVESAQDLDLKPQEAPQPCQMEFLTGWGIDARRLTCDELDLVRSRLELATGDRMGRPILRKTHEKFRSAPDGSELFPAAASRAALVIIRDPRDVVCSAARHFNMSLDATVDLICRRDPQIPGTPSVLMSRQPQGSWSEHLDSWRRLPTYPVAVYRYEDFRAEPYDTFGAALAFAGLDVSESELAHAIESTRFEKLQSRERESGFTERSPSSNVPFFRKGQAGGWRDELSAGQVTRIERNCGALMEEFGYRIEGRSTSAPMATAPLRATSGEQLFKGAVPPKQDVPLHLSTWLTKDDDVITSWVGDDLVLVTPDYELMGLDKMGALIWDFLDMPMSFQGLVDALCASFGIDAATCIDDTTPMLQLLLNGGALNATN
ncbi:MAG: PqqD family peptide modification chaperone [Actinomycetota bacterium]|nr:PqqD family peptide modification chaperone [Actinomycetota bacterium]